MSMNSKMRKIFVVKYAFYMIYYSIFDFLPKLYTKSMFFIVKMSMT